MKTRSKSGWCAVLAALPLALVNPASAGQEPESPLAVFQATIDYCVQINPSAASTYREQLAAMEQGVDVDELARLRGTDDFKNAYARTRATLDGTAKARAARACNEFLGAGAATAGSRHAVRKSKKDAAAKSTRHPEPRDTSAGQSDERKDEANVDRL